MGAGAARADALQARHGRGSTPPPARTAGFAGGLCDRCAAAKVRGIPGRTSAPYWDPGYRMCPTCTRAVAVLFDETDGWPRPDGDGWRFPSHPAHTGAPDFLWRPEIRGFAAQVANQNPAIAPSLPPGAPATPSPRALEPPTPAAANEGGLL